ncbi:hypothetical protein E2320_010812 [Naja naja]|nr:hypothetical protein E2320_010812 [Naja naja]
MKIQDVKQRDRLTKECIQEFRRVARKLKNWFTSLKRGLTVSCSRLVSIEEPLIEPRNLRPAGPPSSLVPSTHTSAKEQVIGCSQAKEATEEG